MAALQGGRVGDGDWGCLMRVRPAVAPAGGKRLFEGRWLTDIEYRAALRRRDARRARVLATGWRDLTDQLTAGQIAALEVLEWEWAGLGHPPDSIARRLLDRAHDHAERNLERGLPDGCYG